MRGLPALFLAACLSACSPPAPPREKTMAEHAAEAAEFNRIAFACTTGVGAHASSAPRANITMALRHEMPDPDNAIADVFSSSCTKSTLDFFFCGAAAQRVSGGLIRGKQFFYGRYVSGSVTVISSGSAAEKDCRSLRG